MSITIRERKQQRKEILFMYDIPGFGPEDSFLLSGRKGIQRLVIWMRSYSAVLAAENCCEADGKYPSAAELCLIPLSQTWSPLQTSWTGAQPIQRFGSSS
jgi:hypothetical protein